MTRVGRRAHLSGKEKRPKCEKENYCSERDWEGRCLDPRRKCEWNEYERILLRARERERGVLEGQSPGGVKG